MALSSSESLEDGHHSSATANRSPGGHPWTSGERPRARGPTGAKGQPKTKETFTSIPFYDDS